MVKRLCTNKRNKSMWTLIFGQMVVQKKSNERGPYILVNWLSANKRNKSVVEWSYILLWLKSRSVRGASHHPAISHVLSVLSTQWISSP